VNLYDTLNCKKCGKTVGLIPRGTIVIDSDLSCKNCYKEDDISEAMIPAIDQRKDSKKTIKSNDINECIKMAKLRYRGVGEFFIFAIEKEDIIYFADITDDTNTAIKHYKNNVKYYGQRASWIQLK